MTAVVLARNEEANIERCLESLRWCNEIIVIDDYSTDKTVKIAESRGAKVFKRKLNNNFAAQRNYGLDKAKGNWVLFIDADELVPDPLSQEIVRRVKENQYDGYLISRREFFLNKMLSCADKPSFNWSFGPIKLLRLARKDVGRWQEKVHERWKVEGRIGVLRNPIYHYSFPDITTALKKINYYSSIEAQKIVEREGEGTFLAVVLYPLGKFLKDFFWQGGWKDGTRGMAYCLLMSLQSFLTKGKAFKAGK